MIDYRLVLDVNRLIQTVEAENGMSDIDKLARQILYFIADADTAQRRLTVSEITMKALFGSVPTVFSRLAKLEASGWIGYQDDPTDGRIKRVVLTTAARRKLAGMSSKLHQKLPGIMSTLPATATASRGKAARRKTK